MDFLKIKVLPSFGFIHAIQRNAEDFYFQKPEVIPVIIGKNMLKFPEIICMKVYVLKLYL